MSEQTSLPPALQPWEPELRHFAPDLQAVLAPLAMRVAQSLGPAVLRDERWSDEPAGYGALSRRGPYERLLSSEWALQHEAPDEFVRRASQGEHLFLELERRTPESAQESWVLLDSGPAQQGAPRLAHLAVLVAFARRARAARLTLCWQALWSFEQPVHDALTPESVLAYLGARTAFEPTPAVLAQWAQRLEQTGRRGELWLVGAPSLAAVAKELGAGVVSVDESGPLGSELVAVVTPPGRRSKPPLALSLPPSPIQVRLLRNPFELPEARRPPPKRHGPTLALHPTTQLAFSHDGHRLLARTELGSVAALPVRNTARAGYGHPTVAALPVDCALVSVVWASRRARAVVLRNHGGVTWLADWDARLQTALPEHAPASPESVPTTYWPSPLDEAATLPWFRSTPGPMAYATRAHLAFMARAVAGESAKTTYSGRTRTLHVPVAPRAAWLNWHKDAVALFHFEEAYEAWREGPPVGAVIGSVDIEVRRLPLALFRGYEVQGVAPSVGHNVPEVFALRADRRSVHVLHTAAVAPQWHAVVMARAPIEAFTVSHDGRLVAWRDSGGEVAIYAFDRNEVVLRVHVLDAGKEVP